VNLCVLSEDAENLALDADIGGLSVDGSHFLVGGLQADEVALSVEAFEGGIRTVDECDDDFAFAGSAGALDEDVISGDDVLVPHGISADFEGINLTVANDIAEGDGFCMLDGFNGFAGSDAAHEGETVHDLAGGTLRQNINGSAAVVGTLQQALGLQIGDVFMNRGQGAKAEAGGNLLIGRGVAVAGSEAGEKVENLFLPAGYGHAGIVANKQRMASEKLEEPDWYRTWPRSGQGG